MLAGSPKVRTAKPACGHGIARRERRFQENLPVARHQARSPIEWQIIGVCHDVHNGGVRRKVFLKIDVPFWQSPWPQAGLAVRTFGDPASMTRSITAVVRTVDPDLPLIR